VAVRFDNSGEGYTATTGVPSGSAYTVLLWLNMKVDTNNYAKVWMLKGGTTVIMLSSGAEGDTFAVWGSVGNASGFTATANTWYRSAIAVSGTASTHYFGAAGASLSSVSTPAFVGDAPSDSTSLTISNESGEHFNGCVAAFKAYSATLTQQEIENEFAQYVPVRTSGLIHWHPFLNAETVDYSGDARTLTGGTGASTEDGPPIPWETGEVGLFLPTTGPPTTVNAENSAGTGVANDSTVTVTDAPRPVFSNFPARPRAANF